MPPHTGVMPSLLAIQTHPKYWRNPLLWMPQRWISSPSASGSSISSSDITTQLQHEQIVIPTEGTYFPWSAGPQNCPGLKFAQVEFVAVLAYLIRNHRMEIVHRPNESSAQAKERVLATTEDCDVGLLLRMRNADKIRLICKPIYATSELNECR